MPKKSFTPEQIVAKLRQIEVLLSQGKPSKPTSYAAVKEGREYLTQYYDADLSTLLKTDVQAYQQRARVPWWYANPGADPDDPNEPANDVRVIDTTTGINDKSFRKSFEYDVYNNVTKVKEYDFDTATVLRETRFTYLTTYASRNYDVISGYRPSPNNLADRVSSVYHIRNAPLQISIYRGPGTCEVSRQTYDFDEAVPTDRANPTQRLNAVAPQFFSSAPLRNGFSSESQRYEGDEIAGV